MIIMFCTNCGTQINEGEKFCPKCGINLQQDTNEPAVNIQTATSSTNTQGGYVEISKPDHYGAYLAWSIVSMVLGMWITGVIAALLNERSIAFFAVGNKLKCSKLQNGAKICLIISLVFVIIKIVATIACIAFLASVSWKDFADSIIGQIG